MALHATMMASFICMLPFGRFALALSTLRTFASTSSFALSFMPFGILSLGGVTISTIGIVVTIASTARRSEGSTVVALAMFRVWRPGFRIGVMSFGFGVKVQLLCLLLLALDLLLLHMVRELSSMNSTISVFNELSNSRAVFELMLIYL